MTRQRIILIIISLQTVWLCACSPINSMEPFDDKQAAIVARAMLPPAAKNNASR